MLSNLVFSFQVVSPVFLVILMGYYIRFKGYLTEETVRNLNAIVIRFALPILFFRNMARSDLKELMDMQFIGFIFLTTLAIFFGALFIAVFIIR